MGTDKGEKRTNSNFIQVILLLMMILAVPAMGQENETAADTQEATPAITQEESAADWYNKGMYLYTVSNYDDALKAFDEVLKIYPQSADAWNSRGTVLGSQKKYDEALRSFGMAVSINSSFAEAWCNMGMIYDLQGDINSAIQCYNKATVANPSYQKAWYLKNRHLDAIGIGHSSLYKEMAAEQGLTTYN